jgi:hypothetical protein
LSVFRRLSFDQVDTCEWRDCAPQVISIVDRQADR